LIYLDNKDRGNKGILISENTFLNNTAFYSSVGIFIRARQSTITPITLNDPLTEDDL
jgi:parallel beta-helix repeat protein